MPANLVQLERLVRRIANALRNGEMPAGLSPLAQQYAEACREASHRLLQCETIIRNGDIGQAIQLAEVSPSLLDVITVLAFGDATKWRGFCKNNDLEIADEFDERCVRRLNECYGKGLQPDSPLYGRYRSAILRKNEQRAFGVLRSIVRVNPSDLSAAEELKRLDGKIFRQYMDRISDAISAGEPTAVTASVEEIESMGFQSKPPPEIWTKAQTIRCSVLSENLNALKTQGDWIGANSACSEIETICEDNGLDPVSICDGRIARVRAWLNNKESAERQEATHRERLVALRREIRSLDSKESELTELTELEIYDLKTSLEEKVNGLLGTGYKPPNEISRAVVNWRDALEKQRRTFQKRERRKRIMKVSSIVVMAIIGVFAITGYLQISGSRETLLKLRRDLNLTSGRKLIDQTESKAAHRLFGFLLKDELAEWQKLVSLDEANNRNYATSFQALDALMKDEIDVAKLSGALDQCVALSNRFAALVPEIQRQKQIEYENLERQVLRAHERLAGSAVTELEASVQELRKLIDVVMYSMPVPDFERCLGKLEVKLRETDRLRKLLPESISIPSSVDEQLATITTGARLRRTEFDSVTRELQNLRTAADLTGFYSTIKQLGLSPMIGVPEVISARAVSENPVSMGSLLIVTLFNNSKEMFEFARTNAGSGFLPMDLTDNEAEAYSLLRNSEAIGATHDKYRLFLNAAKTSFIDWLSNGTLDINRNARGWWKVKVFTLTDTNASRFAFDETQYGVLGGYYYMNSDRKQLVYSVEHVGKANETAAFFELGLHQLFAPAGNQFNQPLIRILDRLKNTNVGHPLFRAFVYLKLTDMMKERPAEWGLAFAPSVFNDIKLLKQAVGKQIQSGEWYLARNRDSASFEIEAVFTGMREVSYEKQATGLLNVYSHCVRDGFEYIGFLSEERQPVINGDTSIPKGEPIWGLNATTTPAVAFYSGMESRERVASPILRLSPLFRFRGKRSSIIKSTGIDLRQPEFSVHLPSLLDFD